MSEPGIASPKHLSVFPHLETWALQVQCQGNVHCALEKHTLRGEPANAAAPTLLPPTTWKICRDPGSNQGPSDLRSDAFPNELSRLQSAWPTSLLLLRARRSHSIPVWYNAGFPLQLYSMPPRSEVERGARGVVVSHPFRMRKALGSNPSVSILRKFFAVSCRVAEKSTKNKSF